MYATWKAPCIKNQMIRNDHQVGITRNKSPSKLPSNVAIRVVWKKRVSVLFRENIFRTYRYKDNSKNRISVPFWMRFVNTNMKTVHKTSYIKFDVRI